MAANDTSNEIDALRKEMSFTIDEQKRDIVKIARHELDTKVNASINEALNVPGLIGMNCKYASFHRCLLEISRG